MGADQVTSQDYHRSIALEHRVSVVSILILITLPVTVLAIDAIGGNSTLADLLGCIVCLGAFLFSILCIYQLMPLLPNGCGVFIVFLVCPMMLGLVFMPFSQIPALQALCLILLHFFLHFRAGRILKQAGYKVGFMGADIRQFSDTPLHRAASDGEIDVAEHFLSYGANVNVKDGYGMTPLDIAKDKGHTAMVEYLESIGAKSAQDIIKKERTFFDEQDTADDF